MEQKTYGLPELTAEVAKQAEVSKKDAERVIKALVSFTKETVGEGNQVRIIGFGTFKKHHAEARKGHNPQNGETIDIPAIDRLMFDSKVRY